MVLDKVMDVVVRWMRLRSESTVDEVVPEPYLTPDLSAPLQSSKNAGGQFALKLKQDILTQFISDLAN